MILRCVLLLGAALGVEQQSQGGTSLLANPIRKVVTMLQNMQKKVAAEGAKEKALYDKYMCYCSSSNMELAKSVADAKAKIPATGSGIEEAESQKAQLEADIQQAKTDISLAKKSVGEATTLRENEAKAFATEKAENGKNIAAVGQALAALKKGVAAGFLQTGAALRIRKIVIASEHMIDADRQDILSFLSGEQSNEYSPQSGEIIGILEQMKETMEKNLVAATSAEESAKKIYSELLAAKEKEIEALTPAIESKTVRVGELGVQIVQLKGDVSDTEATLKEDTQFLADLEKNCASKTKEYEVVVKTRSEELVALAETIKILNTDDALELFKKTLPSTAASFVQMEVTLHTARLHALELLNRVQRSTHVRNSQIDLIAMALNGKDVSFEKVVKMIDDMVALLKQEQTDDESKKGYCNKEFDSLEDKTKILQHSIKDSEASMDDAKNGIAMLASDIKSLEEGIVTLDKAVAEATEQRRQENTDYKELMASDSAAKELLVFAINRLNKFYNPKIYNPAPKRELSEEARISLNMGGTLAPTSPPGGISGTGIAVLAQVSVHTHHQAAPPPPPEAVGAYKKKGEESSGVIAMIKLLIDDLEKELVAAETAEADAQTDYETMLKDSAQKRTVDTKALSQKSAAKADMEANLLAHKEKKGSTSQELAATFQVIHSLHSECDWLLQYFDVRKEARGEEIDSLKNAKAVLSGADYSLIQIETRSLRGHN